MILKINLFSGKYSEAKTNSYDASATKQVNFSKNKTSLIINQLAVKYERSDRIKVSTVWIAIIFITFILPLFVVTLDFSNLYAYIKLIKKAKSFKKVANKLTN